MNSTSHFSPFAVVTGASRGIGRALCHALVQRGYSLLAVGLEADELASLQRELSPERVQVLAVDLTNGEAALQVFETAKACFNHDFNRTVNRTVNHTELLINCAGFGLYGEHLSLDSKRVRAMIDLNVIATTSLSTLFAQVMKNRGSGTIMNVASTASFQPLPTMAAYAASKSYVVSFSQALALELQPFGVRVCILYPGTTQTAFLKDAGTPDAKGIFSFGTVRDRIAMTPESVAEAAMVGLEKGTTHIVPGVVNQWHRRVLRWAPKEIAAKLFHRLGARSRVC